MTVIFISMSLLTSVQARQNNGKFTVLKTFMAEEARQGIAVDENFIYVVGTQKIAKYDKNTQQWVKQWQGAEDGPVIHLDSGVVVGDKLYCAHSNYPGVPMTSSVEIWDTKTLEHKGSHSFGIFRGSCTWIDRFDGFWWVAFAHYNKLKDQTDKGSEWTTVVKFDDSWQEQESWVFPKEVYEKFGRMSNSGGSWGPDSLLYCTGHDNAETYVLRLPKMGSVLELVAIVPIDIYGQGIAWDHSQPGIIYGIRKKDHLVVISQYEKFQE